MKKLSLKEKILLAIVFCVDKDRSLPFGNLSFPFAPEMSLDDLSNWVFCERPVFYTTVSRMGRENLLVVENGVVKLLDNGKKFLATNFPYIFQKNKNWDGLWTIIVFNIKEVERYKRDKLRNYLIKIKFAPVSSGVWVSPHEINISEEDIIYIEGKLGDREKEIIFGKLGILKINDLYRSLYSDLKTALNLHDNDRIRFLKSRFLEILALDPNYPSVLLPNSWMGDKVKRLCLKKR